MFVLYIYGNKIQKNLFKIEIAAFAVKLLKHKFSKRKMNVYTYNRKMNVCL